MVQYDRNVLQTVANSLYSKATTVVVLSILSGALLGGAGGAARGVLTSGVTGMGPVISGVGFLVLGVFVGWARGEAKALAYRVQAQTLLCQMQIEANTAPKPPAS